MRAWQLNESLWLDELHTSWVAADGSVVAQRALMGNQPRLYFDAVRLSVWLLGETEFALRLPSLLAGVAAVGVLGAAAWRISGSKLAAAVMLFIAAVDHELIFYAGEARVYAVLHLAAALHIWAIVELTFLRKKEPSGQASSEPRIFLLLLIGWGFTGVLMLWLHFLAGLFLALEFAFLLAWAVLAREVAWKEKRWLLATGFLVLLSVSVFAPQLAEIAARRENWRAFISEQASLFEFAWYVWPLPFYVAAPLVLLAFAWGVLKTNRGVAIATVMVWLALSLPLLAWAATAGGWLAIFHARYFAPSLAALLLIPAAAMRGIANLWWRFTFAAVVCLGALWFNGTLETFRQQGRFIADRNEDWRAAVASINQANDGAPVVIYSGLIEADELTNGESEWREFAALPVRGIYRLQDRDVIPLPMTLSEIDPSTIDQLQNERRVILLVRGEREFAREVAESFNAIAGGNWRLNDQREFGDVSTFELSKP